MRIIRTKPEMIQVSKDLIEQGIGIGLVPTMGALHLGHKALLDQSLRENQVSLVSIFVNPTQFNNPEDLEKYPRNQDQDLDMLKSWGVDLVFIPTVEEMYPHSPEVQIDFGKLGKVLEGKFRPGHFEGVGQVVSKLMNLVSPSRTYFGLKDLQQFLLIKKMVEDLDMRTEVVGVSTVREASGLAMSSRNKRLSDRGLIIAAKIYTGLQMLKERISRDDRFDDIMEEAHQYFKSIRGLEIEYLEVVDAQTLETPNFEYNGDLAICIAAEVEGVRLIDNLYLQQD